MAVKTPDSQTCKLDPDKKNKHQLALSTGQARNGRSVCLSPHHFEAVIFDMDGVVTQTAKVHAAAWKTLFDDFLKDYAKQNGQPFKAFDIQTDYLNYVDGKKREDGLTSFLDSRGIRIPQGSPEDSEDQQTVYGLSKRKDQLFLKHLHEDGVKVFDSTISLIKTLRENHVRTAIISASRNCEEVLKTAKVLDLFDARVDGVVAAQLNLPGKPEPDVFLEAAKRLNVPPEKAVVVEDAIAGVEAGNAGGFALVIGVNRNHHAKELKAHGADVVVDDLSQVALLRQQDSSLHHSNLQAPDWEINDWCLIYDRYVAQEEGRRETLCALGNGYFVTRAAEAGAKDDAVHYPGTYLAGGYNRLFSQIKDQRIRNEDLVNFPNWLVLKFKINDGDWFSLDQTEICSFKQTLNLQEGLLYRDIRFRNEQGQETELHERRLVHMRDVHYAGLELRIQPLNWNGKLTIHSALDGTVVNNNVKKFDHFQKRHLEPMLTESLAPDTIFLQVRTNQSHIQMAQAARTSAFLDEQAISPNRRNLREDDYIAQEFDCEIREKQTLRLEKILALFTSRDNAISECGLETKKWIANAPDFDALYQSQIRTWEHLWHRFDIGMDITTPQLKKRASLVLRLHVFQVLQTLSYESMDRDIGVPARGWHGEAYQGHVFWDNILVFRYLNLRLPDLTGSLIKYRYRRLNAARRQAKKAGFQGAMFPWQSGSDGEEETPPLYVNPISGQWEQDFTHLQRHVNSAIVYNIWQYFQVTGDIDFMFSYGVEIMLEIARFWASMATYNPELDRYEIVGVVGPDEYHDRFPGNSPHEGLRNNTYTNVMAVWVFCRILEVLEIMPDDYRHSLVDKVDLKDEELKRWDDISRKMRVVFLDDQVISQFEGYETLPELDWDQYRKSGHDLQHLDDILRAKGDSPNHYKVSKQADVLMLFYLFDRNEMEKLFKRLDYPFEKDTIPRNIEYYEKRTTQGSTLSRVVYSWVLARSDRARSLDLFIEAFESDLNDIQGGTTPEGIHLGAMAGSLDIVQRCYTGLVMKENVLWFNPRLPQKCARIEFIMHYRFHCLNIKLSQEKLEISAMPSVAQQIQIGFEGKTHPLEAGQSLTFHL